ncbi:MAG: iron uptake porin [Phormidesmis sp. RL_2_1]|nr:iron uptake porin [Phormidesmis sp. RL_2_1]
MTNTLLKALLVAPAALGAALAVSSNAVAAEAVAVETTAVDSISDVAVAEPIQLAQVTSVSELSDVQPGDWAFTALQRLVEEYGCLEGYPDRTYRGNRALTRYEFAAGLNACLDVVIQLIGPESDLEAINRLQEEFAAELATLRGRVDGLETGVAELRAQQFSTTTKLRGQVDAHLVVPFDDAAALDEADATFEYRARLNFDTSFTGEDRLRIRLQGGDNDNTLANSVSGLANGGSGSGGDGVTLDDVYYSFPVGNRISAIIAANSIETDDFVTSTIVPFDGPSVADAGGPEFYDVFGGTGGDFGAGVNIAFTPNVILDLGYSSDSSNENVATGGLFNEASYIAQLNFLSDGIFDAAVTYIDSDLNTAGDPEYTIAGLLSLDFGNFVIGGHYAYTPAVGGGDLDSYMGGIAINDFLGSGNQFGVYGGISPDLATDPLLIEGYYQINVNEFFTLTPAIIYTDNDSGSTDDTAIYGAIRTTFSF